MASREVALCSSGADPDGADNWRLPADLTSPSCASCHFRKGDLGSTAPHLPMGRCRVSSRHLRRPGKWGRRIEWSLAGLRRGQMWEERTLGNILSCYGSACSEEKE